jgi:PAS domain S-box-containing protein
MTPPTSLLAAIVESSDDAIISKSLDGIIQSWNAAAERLFGYTAAQAVGRHISLIIPPDRITEEERIIATLKAGQRIEHFDTVRLRSDGKLVQVSLTISPVRDEAGRVVGASKIARDITGRREAEERERRLLAEAATANAKFRAFFDQGPLYAGVMALDGTLLEANRLSLEACAYTREQVIGKKFWECPWWSPSPELMATIRAGTARAAAGEVFRAELPYYVADGSERMVDFILLPIKDESGRVIFLAPTGSDITERRRAEAALREADRRKDEFLATLAHELRNPLAPIRNSLQVIRLSPDRQAREQAGTLMERQLEQMVRLVDDLLDVSRITRGKLELRREQVQLSAVVASAVDTSRPLIDHLGHELTVTLPRQPIVVDADLTRLAQVISNLLNNSAKYTDRGGHIWLTAERQGSEVVVSVRDTGIGIAADELPRVFGMFSQVDHSLERSQGGLGIGLTLVKRLVEMHGGRVEARSKGLGKGAEFIVGLPLVVGAAGRPAAGRADESAAPKSSLRILIVDDNRDGADSLVMLLRLMGNDTRTAYDGQEGVDVAEEFRPDVMLLDIGLPKLNGYEACRRIREQEGGKDIFLIAVTGWGQEDDRRRSADAGFDRHLVKPVDPQELMKLLAGLQPVKSRRAR